MKNCLLLALFLSVTISAVGGYNHDGESTLPAYDNMPENYQQFKHQLVHTKNLLGQPLPAVNYKNQDDYTMLYVAGGILTVTSGVAYLNQSQANGGFFSISNTGLLIGGGFSATVFITKYLIDHYR